MDGIEKVMATIAVCVALLFAELMWINHLNEKAFITAGYTRESLPGISQTQWVKK